METDRGKDASTTIDLCVKESKKMKECSDMKEINSLSETEFLTHIISEICDYAKANGYEITDSVKTIGKNIVAITEIVNFDNWEGA